MSWLFSQALVAACSEVTSSDGEPLSPLSVMPTPHKFWRNDKTMEPSRLSQFGLTCAVLTEDHGRALLTSYLAAFPARTSASLEPAPDWRALVVGSGGNISVSCARWDPASSTLRTAQSSFLEDSTSSSPTLPRSGLMLDGACYPLPPLARPTCESASGYLLTAAKLWTTPSASDSQRGGTITERMTGSSLAQQVNTPAMWPTPTASLGSKGGRVTPRKGRESGTLIEAVSARMFPTPAARDYRSPNAKSYAERGGGSKGEQLPNFIGGQLNPPWVEWLMGWPCGWTELKPLAMNKFHEWQQQHGSC